MTLRHQPRRFRPRSMSQDRPHHPAAVSDSVCDRDRAVDNIFLAVRESAFFDHSAQSEPPDTRADQHRPGAQPRSQFDSKNWALPPFRRIAQSIRGIRQPWAVRHRPETRFEASLWHRRDALCHPEPLGRFHRHGRSHISLMNLPATSLLAERPISAACAGASQAVVRRSACGGCSDARSRASHSWSSRASLDFPRSRWHFSRIKHHVRQIGRKVPQPESEPISRTSDQSLRLAVDDLPSSATTRNRNDDAITIRECFPARPGLGVCGIATEAGGRAVNGNRLTRRSRQDARLTHESTLALNAPTSTARAGLATRRRLFSS